LVRRFLEAGATDAAHAVTPEALGEHRSLVFDQMTKRGVFLPTSDGRFFVDERAAVEYIGECRSRGWLVAGVLLFVLFLLWLFGHSGR